MHENAKPNDAAPRASVLAILAVAFAVRAMFLFTTPDGAWPHSAHYEGDAPKWVEWAAQLDRGQKFEFEVPMRTPGMAYALHWLIPGTAGAPFVAAKLVLCALSAITCAWFFVAVRREISSRVAWIAAALTCFSFGQYEIATSLNNEAPYALLVVALVDTTLRFVARPVVATALFAGALHGLAILFRAEHTLVLAAFTAFALWRVRGARSWANCVLVPVAAVGVCLPWTLHSRAGVERFNTVPVRPIDYSRADPPWASDAREYFEELPAFARGGNFELLTHLSKQRGAREITRADAEAYFREQFGHVPDPLATWTLSSTKGPLDFALANDPRSQGGFSRAGLLDGHDEEPIFAFGRPSHTRLYNHGYAVGLAHIRADFAGWLALVGKKLVRFMDGASLGWTAFDAPFGSASVRRAVDLATPQAPSRVVQVLLLAPVVAGAVLALKRRVAGLWLIVIATKLAITVAFYGYARQAVSIAPAFYVCAALALDALLARAHLGEHLVRRLGVALFAVALIADVAYFVSPPVFEVRPARANAKIVGAPQWGTGAFETFEEIALVPRS